jgi:predicted peptidase
VLACLAQARRELNIDPKRITLTGLSQGGHGTWVIGARHPELFAAVAPVCGYEHPSTIAPRLAGRPVWAFHGGKDDIVPAWESERLVEAIKKEGKKPEPRLTIFPEANHNSWDKAYREAGLGTWLMEQGR